MIVSTLSLSHFRNYEQVLIEPDAGVTVFTGPNAQGKTNIPRSPACLLSGAQS